ncbi:MAG: hypothetical protein AB8C84_09370 [Oligoflexales bacterium]
MKTNQKIFQSPLFYIAVIELWLSFIVYDYAISKEFNFFTSLVFGFGFVVLNHRVGQGFFGPNLNFAPLRVLVVILVISMGGVAAADQKSAHVCL